MGRLLPLKLVLLALLVVAVADTESQQQKQEDISVTVVVLTNGNYGLLRNCLRALFEDAQTYSSNNNGRVEVIVAPARPESAAPLAPPASSTADDANANDASLLAAFFQGDSLESTVSAMKKLRPAGVSSIRLLRTAQTSAAVLSEAMNASAAQEAVVFVDESVEVSPGFLTAVVQKSQQSIATANEVAGAEGIDAEAANSPEAPLLPMGTKVVPTVAAFGCLLLNSDMSTVFNAGVGFSHSRGIRMGATNAPTPFNLMQGESIELALEVLKQTGGEVVGVGPECFAVPKKAYQLVGPFSTSMSSGYALLDFSLRAYTMHSIPSVLCLDCKAVHFDDSPGSSLGWSEDFSTSPDDTFLTSWQAILNERIKAKRTYHNVSIVWNMECGAGQTLGFTTEAVNFIAALEGKVALKVEIANKVTCRDELNKAGWPKSKIDLILRLAKREVEFKDSIIQVIHKDPGRYRNFVGDRYGEPTPVRVVGRSMFETDKIPIEWQAGAKHVQRIWVPSQFNIDTFSASGINASVLRKLPEPIDIHLYSPQRTPLRLAGPDTFVFLTVGKWEKRKGYDVLIKAFMEEFSQEDNVLLAIKSNADQKNTEEFESFVSAATEHKLSIPDAKSLPRKPILVKSLIPLAKMPSLYAGADCFVLSSRGEGWGLPIVEAMATGLPVIATNWSGSTEFLKPDVSFPLPIDGLVDSPQAGHKWANPSVVHLRQLMRRVYTDRAEAKQVGLKARDFIVQMYSHEAIAAQVFSLIDEVLAAETKYVAPSYVPPYGNGNTWSTPGTSTTGSTTTSTLFSKTKIKINP